MFKIHENFAHVSFVLKSTWLDFRRKRTEVVMDIKLTHMFLLYIFFKGMFIFTKFRSVDIMVLIYVDLLR